MNYKTQAPTLMVVDDSPSNLALLNNLLSQKGYRVMQFPRGELALNAARQNPPDLILLDIMMPEMDGFEVCRHLKADKQLHAIPVLFISAMNDLDHKLQAFAEGGVDYVTKPFQEEEVLVRVHTQLELRRTQCALENYQRHLEALVEKRTADLQTERLRLRNALDAVQAGTWEWHIDTDTVAFNQRWAQTLGYTLEEINPTTMLTWRNRLHPEDEARVRDTLEQHLSGAQDRYETEYRIRHRRGYWVWLRTLGRVIERSSEGKPRVMAGIDLDITEHKNHQAHLDYIARHDTLTGLPNRVAFAEYLRDLMSSEQHLAVAYVDLDDLVALNETHGRGIVDKYLVMLARRLNETIDKRYHVARIGGDEFAILLSDPEDCTDTAMQNLLHAVSQPISIGKQTLLVTASIGLTRFPQTRLVDAEQLLRQADQAMYQAKLAGKNRYHRFDPEYDENTRERHLQLEDIRRGLAAGEFVLYYQPKIHLRTGKVIGFEALIRWQHPERGLLSPGVFIPLIENHPLLISVGDWVIDAALQQLEQWQLDGISTSVSISVNVSTIQLHDQNFVNRLEQQLIAHPSITANRLELEILETGAIDDMDHASALINRLRTLGVTVSLDDFGTGYSSLTFLKRLAVDTLKIDQSFVRQMLGDADHIVIVDSIISLANSFGRKVIAEGVETEDQGCLLLQLGCECAQGYGIARPMPAEAVKQWLIDWRPPRSWRETITVSKQDIPMLLAEIEHQVWLKQLQAYLTGGSEHPPQLDGQACRFGKWLQNAGLEPRFKHNPHWTTLRARHEALHDSAKRLVERRYSDPKESWATLLPKLQSVSDALLSTLRALRAALASE